MQGPLIEIFTVFILLDTKFQRVPGGIGNPKTWDFPVIYRVIERNFLDKVVNNTDYEVLTAVIDAARDLEEKGVNAITATCGFLAKFQKEISNSVNIPVFTSSLKKCRNF